MTEIRVKCCAKYVPDVRKVYGRWDEMTEPFWTARHFVKTLKGGTFNNDPVTLPVIQDEHGRIGVDCRRRIRPNDQDAAIKYFGSWGASKLEERVFSKWRIVPVPSSSTVASDLGQLYSIPQRLSLALTAARAANDVDVMDVISFASPQTSNRDGVRRTKNENMKLLRLDPSFGRKRYNREDKIVLIDDVVTRGDTLLACAELLTLNGISPNRILALCAGSTVLDSEKLVDPWNVTRILS